MSTKTPCAHGQGCKACFDYLMAQIEILADRLNEKQKETHVRVRLQLTRWRAGIGTGPFMSIDADDIVAIEETDYASVSAPGLSRWRTMLYLRGGNTVVADEDFRDVEKALNKIRHTETVGINNVTKEIGPR